MIKIIFVCLGNICRSPLAEAICQKKINDLGLSDKLACDSAGTAGYHIDENPDPRSVKVARAHDVPISHKGQKFTQSLANDFDYWIAMDQSNYWDMVAEMGVEPKNLVLLRQFDNQNQGADVPDPYYGGDGGFEEVYQMLDRSIDGLLKHIQDQHPYAF